MMGDRNGIPGLDALLEDGWDEDAAMLLVGLAPPHRRAEMAGLLLRYDDLRGSVEETTLPPDARDRLAAIAGPGTLPPLSESRRGRR